MARKDFDDAPVSYLRMKELEDPDAVAGELTALLWDLCDDQDVRRAAIVLLYDLFNCSTWVAEKVAEAGSLDEF